jgi:hypothetical protein
MSAITSAITNFLRPSSVGPLNPSSSEGFPQVPPEVNSSDDVSFITDKLIFITDKLIDIKLQKELTFMEWKDKIYKAILDFYKKITSFLKSRELNSENKKHIIDTFRWALDKNIISVSQMEKFIQNIDDEIVQKEEVTEKKEQMLYILYELNKLCSERGSIKSKILLVIQEYLGSRYIPVNMYTANTLLDELLIVAKENVILVENLKNGVTEYEVKELFSPYGSIESVFIFKDSPCVMGAHITYRTRDEVEKCNKLFKEYDKLIPEGSGFYLKVMCLINYDDFMLIQKKI